MRPLRVILANRCGGEFWSIEELLASIALAHACPVIAAQGSPWSGLLEHRCGWWPGISSEGIANALQAATTLDPSELRLMGASGKAWMKNAFAWDTCAGMMADLYCPLRQQ